MPSRPSLRFDSQRPPPPALQKMKKGMLQKPAPAPSSLSVLRPATPRYGLLIRSITSPPPSCSPSSAPNSLSSHTLPTPSFHPPLSSLPSPHLFLIIFSISILFITIFSFLNIFASFVSSFIMSPHPFLGTCPTHTLLAKIYMILFYNDIMLQTFV